MKKKWRWVILTAGLFLGTYFMISAVFSAWVSITPAHTAETHEHLVFLKYLLSIGTATVAILVFVLTRNKGEDKGADKEDKRELRDKGTRERKKWRL